MKRLGLLGKNISYSFSPKYFKEKFQELGITEFQYETFDIQEISKIPSIFKIENLIGFNVTIPYKQDIIPLLDELSEDAKMIGAVNTVVFDGNKKVGHNTDVLGFTHSIQPLISNHKKALILGTGGSAKAIKVGLEKLNIESVYVSRNPKEKELSYSNLTKAIIQNHQIIVNCTPLGTFPNIETCPLIPYKYLSEKHLLYDLTYNPSETEFLKRGKQQGTKIKNGLEMLQKQADFAWELWENKLS